MTLKNISYRLMTNNIVLILVWIWYNFLWKYKNKVMFFIKICKIILVIKVKNKISLTAWTMAWTNAFICLCVPHISRQTKTSWYANKRTRSYSIPVITCVWTSCAAFCVVFIFSTFWNWKLFDYISKLKHKIIKNSIDSQNLILFYPILCIKFS